MSNTTNLIHKYEELSRLREEFQETGDLEQLSNTNRELQDIESELSSMTKSFGLN